MLEFMSKFNLRRETPAGVPPGAHPALLAGV